MAGAVLLSKRFFLVFRAVYAEIKASTALDKLLLIHDIFPHVGTGRIRWVPVHILWLSFVGLFFHVRADLLGDIRQEGL